MPKRTKQPTTAELISAYGEACRELGYENAAHGGCDHDNWTCQDDAIRAVNAAARRIHSALGVWAWCPAREGK